MSKCSPFTIQSRVVGVWLHVSQSQPRGCGQPRRRSSGLGWTSFLSFDNLKSHWLFQGDAIFKAVERELAACVGDACLQPPGMSLRLPQRNRFFLLQRWSLRWNSFIDVQSVGDINDGDKIMVVLAFAP